MHEEIMNLIEYSKGGILSKEIIKNDKLNVTLMCMAAGTDLSEHTSTRQGTVYIVEGKGIFSLKGEDIVMAPGVLIYMEADSVHSLKAQDDTSFILTLA
ncbi:MAG: cupin domain-containing protein [Candidatus Moranbacteria bacterium]|jgi:quercetin dioxygenase-like cupin family protein|nr:cupin domain-containing protein [Candidatus Moranbacteria bacterium]